MKRLICFIILLLSLAVAITGCSCAATSKKDTDKDDDDGEKVVTRFDGSGEEPIDTQGSQSTTESSDSGETESTVHTHLMSEWTVSEEATCLSGGVMSRRCLGCNFVERMAYEDDDNHNPAEAVKENEVVSTCQTAGGYDSVVYCADCGEKIDTEYVSYPLVEHKPSDIRETGSYCGSTPVSNVYCGDCGAFVISFGHRYEREQCNPTCTERGYVREYCTVCGDTSTTYYDATGHTGQWQTVREATCLVGAERTEVCFTCGYVMGTAEGEVLSHEYYVEEIDSCLVYSCSLCGAVKTENITTDVYKVVFKVNGGSPCLDTVVKAGDAVALPISERDGYYFAGWYTDGALTEEYTEQRVYADLSLYAKWVEIEEEPENNTVDTRVGKDFVFEVVMLNKSGSEEVSKYVKVYDVCGNEMDVKVTPKGNGVYEISCDEYIDGAFYYTTVSGPVKFTDTDENEKQFTVEGEAYSNIALKDFVKRLDFNDVYGVAESTEGFLLLTSADFEVGDCVAIYEGTEENVQLILQINARSEMVGYNAYLVSEADYEEVFEFFETSFSSDVDFREFEVDMETQKNIEQELMSSPYFAGFKKSVENVFTANNLTLGNLELKVNFKPGIEKLEILVEIIFSTEKTNENTWFEVRFTITGTVHAKCDAYFSGIKNYGIVLDTGYSVTFDVDLTYKIGHEDVYLGKDIIDPLDKKTYNNLLKSFKDNYKSKDNGDLKQMAEAARKVAFGKVSVPVFYGIDIYFWLGVRMDCVFSGTLSIDMTYVSQTVIGARSGATVSEHHSGIEEMSIGAVAKIEAGIMLDVELGITAYGITLYGEMLVGPRLELCLSGVSFYNGKDLQLSKGAYFGLSMKFEMSFGMKVQIWVVFKNITIFDAKLEALSEAIPIFEVGTKEIALHFVNEERPFELEYGCDESASFELNVIDTDVRVFDVTDLKYESVSKDCSFTITDMSDKSCNARIENGSLVISDLKNDITIKVKVKYNDVVEKEIQFVISVDHKMTEATCTKDGICTVCGTIGTEAKGHTEELVEGYAPTCTEKGLTDGKKCSVCNETLEGLEDIDATGHTEVAVEGYAPTCTEDGLSDGTVCSSCGTVMTPQKVISALGHDEEIIKGYPATCIQTGLSDGKRCKVCSTVFVLQEEIPKTSHLYASGDICVNCGLHAPVEWVITIEDEDTVLFGLYPQSQVTSDDLIYTLNSLAGELPTDEEANGWIDCEDTSYEWDMRYIDVEYQKERYRGVCSLPSYENYSEPQATVWYKFEPISWSVIAQQNGNALLLCDMVIDNKEFDDEDNNYAQSNIRKWLNEEFYNTAFGEMQKMLIFTAMVDNSASSADFTWNDYCCENTRDKIFLLCYQEAIRSEFGFANNSIYQDRAKRKSPTEYALMQGVYEDGGNSSWWLRSPYAGDSDEAYCVYDNGAMGEERVYQRDGVVPALWIFIDQVQ